MVGKNALPGRLRPEEEQLFPFSSAASNIPAPPNAAPLQPGDLVDEREAAAILSASVQTLRNWRWAGKGPRVRKIGQRLVRYYRADLAAFIEAGSSGKAAA